jgi:hypothetical protein
VGKGGDGAAPVNERGGEEVRRVQGAREVEARREAGRRRRAGRPVVSREENVTRLGRNRFTDPQRRNDVDTVHTERIGLNMIAKDARFN